MPSTPAGASRLSSASPWWLLLALASAFTLSQSFRTVAGIMGPPLAADLGLSPQQLGLWAGAFHFSFGVLQLVMGVSIDLFGIRRTVLTAFPMAVLGSALAASAQGFGSLLVGQMLIGVGCAPAFLGCTVFIARHFAPQRFAALSGLAMAIGTVGMLLTGSPLAWLIEAWSWRAGFGLLALLALAAWLWMARSVHEPRVHAAAALPRESPSQALRRFGALFLLAHTWGIVALGGVTYAALLALRGLWLGPMLISRHGFSLLQSGHVALALALTALVGPLWFGRMDPGPAARRRWLLACTLALALLFVLLAAGLAAWLDVALMLAIGVLSGSIVLQYADVRAAYPAQLTGRALALFTMAMFLGVAAMQWATGWVASYAQGRATDPYAVVMLCIAAALLLAALAFRVLPQPAQAKNSL